MENFYTKSLKAVDMEQPIVRFNLCAYAANQPTEAPTHRSPTNHWVCFLELATDGSVKVDMTPGGGNDWLGGIIMLESKPDKKTSSNIKTMAFESLQSPTVATIMSLITKNNRDKYTFTRDGEGCRFWIYTLISDLEKAGLVAEGSAVEASNTLSYYWSSSIESQPRPIDEGVFA